jgi:copper(I)-binding protein
MLALVAVGAALAGCSPQAEPGKPGVTVENAWVRLPPVAGRPGAAYFTLRSSGGSYTLESIASPQVGRIELHDSMMSDGVMKMAPMTPPALPDRGEIKFEPGGNHAMLFEIDPGIKAGDRIRLSFTLQPKLVVEAEVPVMGAGDAPPMSHNH